MISLIVAFDEERGIGRLNTIPWHIPGELKWVGQTTRYTPNDNQVNALIMGRHTWDSLPAHRRPLPGRITIVVTSQADTADKYSLLGTDSAMVIMKPSLASAIDAARQSKHIDTAFIFGGERLYRDAMASDKVDELLLTHIPGYHECDTFFPALPEHFVCVERDDTEYGDIVVQRERWVKS